MCRTSALELIQKLELDWGAYLFGDTSGAGLHPANKIIISQLRFPINLANKKKLINDQSEILPW